MNKHALVLLGCTLGLSACSEPRVPDDAQLATLLQRSDAGPDARARVDALAVGCLRAWSGDPELARGLSVLIAGEDGRKRCRSRLDEWIADAKRNPAAFTFDDISTPEVARRAMALLDARTAAAPKPGDDVPAALRKPGPVAKPRPADPNVDLGAAGAELAEAEALCVQAAQAAAAAGAGSGLQRFSQYCGRSLQRLRTSMETAAKAGHTPQQLERYAVSARNIANTAREMLAAPPG